MIGDRQIKSINLCRPDLTYGRSSSYGPVLNVLRYEDPAILMSQEPNTSSVQEITNTVTGASASARKDTYVH